MQVAQLAESADHKGEKNLQERLRAGKEHQKEMIASVIT